MECTTYNGYIDLVLEKNTIYKLIACFHGQRICRVIYVNSNLYVFSFIRNRTITFTLRDYYYNLPIERGTIVLWQNK